MTDSGRCAPHRTGVGYVRSRGGLGPVVGQPHPDWGEAVTAFVVARDGAALDTAELDALCLEQIARFKRPRDYRTVEALPKNNDGKVLKTELRARLAES
jgi:acyl-CoA synthetase (AMP-forming)/AMP-acid ligase II